jgi:large subunit ribosomal protein L15
VGEGAGYTGLGDLRPARGSRKRRKRVGRGPGSGRGGTSGRGSKGQLARSGGKSAPWFEGGQMPLQRRVPKRGFRPAGRCRYQVVNVGDLSRCDSSLPVTPEVLHRLGLARDRDRVIKILAKGKVTAAYVVKAHAFSRRAQEMLEAAGGRTEVIPPC